LAEKVYLSLKDLDVYKIINMETCTRCGACANSCPAYKVTKDDFAVPAWKSVEFRKILNRQRGFLSSILGQRPVPKDWLNNIATKGLYLCSLCGRCMPGCVFTIQNLELWEDLRAIIYKEGEASSNLINVNKSLEANKNPYNNDHTERLGWLKESGINSMKKGQKADTLFYVGCTSSYQEKSIANCTATILEKSNEDWSLFGEDEWCCGDPHFAIGNHDKAKEFAKHNLDIASSLGAKKIITSCAHCYRMWKYKYPEILRENRDIKIIHITEYLKECLEAGKLKIDSHPSIKITYHDPCYLARLGDIVNEPRTILDQLTNNYIEMKERKFDTFCCGGGGMLEAVNIDLWTNIGNERLNQASMTKADVLVSACPLCKRSLKQAATRTGKQINVLDITELVAAQMKE